MKRHRKVLLAFLAGAGFLLALLVALILLAPWLINTTAIKERALALLERETGMRMSYARAEVTLFPRPRVAIRGVGLDVPGVAQGTVATLEVDPELLPLLRGQVRIGSVLLEAPDFRVSLPAKEKKEKPASLEEVEKDISSLLAALRQRMPGTVVTIRNGRLELSDGDGPIVALREMEVRIALPPDRLTVHIRCSSQYWEGLLIETSVRPEGLHAETRIETAGFRVRELAERLSPGATPWLGETVLSLRGRIDSEGVRSVKVEIAGAVPTLTIRRESRSRVVRVRTLKAAVELNDKEIRATLSDLALDEPRLRLSGDLAVDRVSPRIEVKLTGQGMEIAPVRDTLQALAGDVPTVRDILDIVRGGDIPRFSLQSDARSPGDLGGAGALRVRARMDGGTVHIPGPGIALEDVGADVTIAGGILEGTGIAARLGKARASEGSLRMGLAGDDPPFHAEFRADGDGGDIHRLLPRLLQPGALREEMDRFRDVRGNVSGHVVLGERLSSIGVRFTVSQVQLAAVYDRIPFPVAVDGGRVSYDGASVAVKGLGGKVGMSSFSGVTGKVDLSNSPVLTVLSEGAHLDLGELYPWVASFEGTRETGKEIRSLRGVVDAGPLSLAGPLRGAGEWTFDATGTITGLELDTPLLPGPLSVPAGRFRIRPESASFSGVEASLLDATGKGTLELNGYRQGVDRIAASFEGGIGPDAAKWAYERIGIPEPFRVKAPFTVTGSEIHSEKGGAVRAKVDLAHPAGPTLSFSALATPGKTTIDPLVIRGADSDARMALQLDPDALRVKFAGTLARVTLEKILPLPVLPGQRIRGEMEGVIDRGKPSRSSARGTLEAAGVKIPWKPLSPLAIRDISLAADGRTVRILSSNLAWDNVPFSLTGTAEFGGEEVIADLDASAGDLDLGKLLPGRKPEEPAGEMPGGTTPPGAAGSAGSTAPAFPVRGTLRLAADSVSLDRFSWRPVRAVAELEGKTVRLSVSEANLCGISTLGSVTLGAGDPSVTLVVSTTGGDIQEEILCLSEKRAEFSGKFSLSSRLTGKGTGDALLRSLSGPFEMDATDGRIRQMSVLAKIFSFLNVTETFRGKFPDFREKGFAYNSLSVRAAVKGGKFTLEEAVLDAPSMKVFATGDVDVLTRETDLKVLVAPFQTLDAVVRNIPIVGYILGGTLVSVPISVKGDIRDPRVTTMEASAVGSGLLGIAERTLKLPTKVVSPFLPGEKKEAAGDAPPAGP